MLQSIFGGALPWSPLDWISLDDTIRGGGSFSSFKYIDSNSIAIFSGFLDVRTLGGAGFASQRTRGDRVWDLSNYDGILLNVKKADGKRYTFSLTDQVASHNQSTISWDCNFTAARDGEQIEVSWSEFKPTYRGRELKNTSPLNLKGIKRFSIMMRSFFGSQEGEFSLSLASISAFKTEFQPYKDKFSDDMEGSCEIHSEKSNFEISIAPQTWFKRLLGNCIGRR